MKIRRPKIALKFIKMFSHDQFHNPVTGDLEEIYNDISTEKGLLRAVTEYF